MLESVYKCMSMALKHWLIKTISANYFSMVKAGAMRKRYILFRYEGPDMPDEEIKRGIYNEAMRFFGELGISYAGLKLMEYDAKTKQGILAALKR
jgi:RNase P/RNase MRP subunit POP5